MLDFSTSNHHGASIDLDTYRNLVRVFGRAHLHQNQLETIVRHNDGILMIRRPGETTWNEERARNPHQYLPQPSGLPPPWTRETGFVTEADISPAAWRQIGMRPKIEAAPWMPPPLPACLPPRPPPPVPGTAPAPSEDDRARTHSARRNELDRAERVATNLADFY